MTNANVAKKLVADYEKALGLEYDRKAEEIANTIYQKYVEPKAKNGSRTAFVEILASKEVGVRLMKIISDAGYQWQTNAKDLRGWLSW